MKMPEIGEFGLIARFAPRFASDLPAGMVGIGDDCAVLPRPGQRSLLVTTDMLVEDVHFLRRRIPPRDLGWKSLAVNLSDIAAMGGDAESAYLALAIPRDTEVEWLDAFFDGLQELGEREGVRLLGGDTTSSPERLVINLTVLGSAPPERLRYRSGARQGDALCVTGDLGDSGGGLRLLLAEEAGEAGGRLEPGLAADAARLLAAHHRPRPHLREGAWLAGRPEVGAMMDVSDGIDSDLRRIMERSGCGTVVELERLPLSGPLRRVAAARGWDPLELAACAGEDYCLLLTADPAGLEALARDFAAAFGRPLAAIGRVEGAPGRLSYLRDGRPAAFARRGFDHFHPGSAP